MSFTSLTSATDLSRLHLDCPSPLPESGRGPSRLHESALCIEFFGNEVSHHFTSHTLCIFYHQSTALQCKNPVRFINLGLCHVYLRVVQEVYSSSTSRLQRLLAESREMVATLENSSGKPVSTTQSPTNTNDVCQPQSSHDNGSHHSHSSNASQEDSKRSPVCLFKRHDVTDFICMMGYF